ncbi:MAG: HEPN domain-containing protein [Promethearchaeota archaeon]
MNDEKRISNNEKLANIWYSQARYDLEAAENSIKEGFFEWACFQAQQSAEKALKSFLYYNRKRNIYSHSIKNLLKEASDIDPNFKSLEKVKILDQYYIPTRYPNGLPDGIPHEYYDKEDAELCVENAKKICSLIGEILKKG